MTKQSRKKNAWIEETFNYYNTHCFYRFTPKTINVILAKAMIYYTHLNWTASNWKKLVFSEEPQYKVFNAEIINLPSKKASKSIV